MNDDDFSDFQGKPQNRYQAFDDLMLQTHSQNNTQQVHSAQTLSTNHQIIEDEFTEFHAPSTNDIHPASVLIMTTSHNTHPMFNTQLITNNNQQYIPTSELFSYQKAIPINQTVVQQVPKINQINEQNQINRTDSEEDFEDFQQPAVVVNVDSHTIDQPKLVHKFDYFNEIQTDTQNNNQLHSTNGQQIFNNPVNDQITSVISSSQQSTKIQSKPSEQLISQLDESFNSFEEPNSNTHQTDKVEQNELIVQNDFKPSLNGKMIETQSSDTQNPLPTQDLLYLNQNQDNVTITYNNASNNENNILHMQDNGILDNQDLDEFEDGEVVNQYNPNLINTQNTEQQQNQNQEQNITDMNQNGSKQDILNNETTLPIQNNDNTSQNQFDEFEDGEVINQQIQKNKQGEYSPQNIIEQSAEIKVNKYNSDLFDDLVDHKSPVLKLQVYNNTSIQAPVEQIDINKVIGLTQQNQLIQTYQSNVSELKLTDLNILSEINQGKVINQTDNNDEDFDEFEEPQIIQNQNQKTELELLVQTENTQPKNDYPLCFVEPDKIGDHGVNIKEILNTNTAPQNNQYQNQSSIPKTMQIQENIFRETTPQFSGKLNNELKNDHFNVNTHVEVSDKKIPQRNWRHKIQLPIGEDADCLDEFCQELSELELDLYVRAIKEYKQLVRDIQQLKIQKQESLDKEEFEVLIVIRDTLRAKEPIAQQLKQRVLYIANLMNLFKERPLSYHVFHYNGGHTLLDLQPELIGNEDFINRLQKELQKATSVLKLIKLRNQLDKIKYEQKYLNFINGLKKIIGMSHRFSNLQSYIDNANEALQDIKIEVSINIFQKKQYVIDQEYLLEHTIVPFLHSREATLQYCKLCFQIGQLVQFQGSWHHVCCVNFYYSSI